VQSVKNMSIQEIQAIPLTAKSFALYGDVIEAGNGVKQFPINYGNTVRFHDLANIDVMAENGKTGVSIFRSTPLPLPITIKLMEYHPLSSQAFIPLSANPYLVVVAPKGSFNASKIQVFKASSGQGVNYHAGTWHHFSLALDAVSDFLVIDRIASENDANQNCIEHHLNGDEQIMISM